MLCGDAVSHVLWCPKCETHPDVCHRCWRSEHSAPVPVRPVWVCYVGMAEGLTALQGLLCERSRSAHPVNSEGRATVVRRQRQATRTLLSVD